MMPLSDWFEKCILNRPAIVESVVYDRWRSAKLFSSSGYTSSKSAHCDDSISSRISVLMRACCPDTVKDFVVSIVVYALQHPPDLAAPHVSKEVFKGIKPSIAYCDSTPTVVHKLLACWRGASSFHALPYSVYSAFLIVLGVAMLKARCLLALKSKTATRTTVSPYKLVVSNNRLFSAGAQAKASCFVTRSVRRLANYLKPSKSLSDKRYFGHSDESFSESVATGSTTHNASLFETEPANTHLMSAGKGANKRNTAIVILSPNWALWAALNDNWVLRIPEFLRSFIRHNVSVPISNVVFSGALPATTGTHHDYQQFCVGVN